MGQNVPVILTYVILQLIVHHFKETSEVTYFDFLPTALKLKEEEDEQGFFFSSGVTSCNINCKV